MLRNHLIIATWPKRIATTTQASSSPMCSKATVRSQLNNGEVFEYRTGQYWVEPPGAKHTLTQNPSRTMPARLLAVLIAPTAAQLTTYDK